MIDEPGRTARRAQRLVFLTGARGLASALSALWLILAARQLSLDDFGNLVTLVALATIFIAASDGGLQFVYAHHVAERGVMDRRATLDVLRRRLLYGLVCAALLPPAYLLAASGNRVLPAVIMGVSVVATGVYQCLLTGYRARGMVVMDGLNEAISRLFVLAAGYLLLHAGAGLVGGTLAYALADVGSAAIVFVLLGRRLAMDDEGDSPDLRLRTTAPLAYAIIVGVVYFRIDVYLLRLISDAAEVGQYGAAYRLLDATAVPAVALGHTVIAHLVPRRGRRRLHEVHRYIGVAVIISIPTALVAAFIAPFVLGTLFGPEYAAATGVAYILLISSVPGAVVFMLSQAAGVIDRRGLAVMSSVALALNVVTNLILIPRSGAVGAAWATVLSQAVFALLLYSVVRVGCLRQDATVEGTTDEGAPC